jgi:hypothetical protein
MMKYIYKHETTKKLHSHGMLSRLKHLTELYPTIIFKATDKNMGFCALQLSHYNDLVLEHLNNPTTFQLVPEFSMEETQIQVSNYFDAIRTQLQLTEAEAKFIYTPRTPKIPAFHCLPKVHKPGQLHGRPIIGATNWITTPHAILLDERLKPYLAASTSILKNSEDLLSSLNELGPLPPTARLVTLDVSALYPNINLGILGQLLRQHTTLALSELANLVTGLSFTQYNDKVYQQTFGIAMGSNASVSIANFYLHHLLDSWLQPDGDDILLYKRFIDDLFFVIDMNDQTWNNLLTQIHIWGQGLQFTGVPPSQTVNFLDLSILINPSTQIIEYKMYQKPLHKFNYISKSSCHPPHTFSGFIKGELIRISRLSSNTEYFNTSKQLFYTRLLVRGYSTKYLNSIFKLATYKFHLVNDPNPKPPEKRLNLIFPYSLHPASRIIRYLTRRNSDCLSQILPSSQIRLVYSVPKNLGSLITKSSLTTSQKLHLNHHPDFNL